MSLQERLTEDVKTAMKAREAGKSRLSVLRMVKASIRNIEIDRKKELNDEDVLDVLAKEVKMRRDSMEDFRKGNRPDLVAALEEEIAILAEYLPAQLSEEEVRALVDQAVSQAQATTAKDMGKVMAILMPQVKGKADGKLVNTLVRERLNQ
ncbi:GatB/YqeY domain-containing protein [Anaeromusa sp.]|uniref:GatB/YqeY domain-containing protein n=1 Tax=Anaeromusa sp. TaxID=1872520 RepID=UPI002630F732|nr:GatB/YqeY domain-containing protein [Anaeromusa sp.]MDD3157825.1 GatB/YqeY domain-containing protein [Anaeromusa sp.]